MSVERIPAAAVPKLAALVRAAQRYRQANDAKHYSIDAAVAAKRTLFAALREVELAEAPLDAAPTLGDRAPAGELALAGRVEQQKPRFWWLDD